MLPSAVFVVIFKLVFMYVGVLSTQGMCAMFLSCPVEVREGIRVLEPELQVIMSLRVSISVERHPDHSKSYKGRHLIEVVV